MPRRIAPALATILVLPLLSSTVHARSAAAYCFPATPGIPDCLAGRFDQFWRTSGGLPVFGFPITPLYDAPTRDGLVLAQMVERNRLEYHPELAPPYDILLGRLGDDLLIARGRPWREEPVGVPKMDCWYAEATEHTVCDQEPGLGFLSYYRSHGLDLGDPGISQREALALWGLPLTEPAVETNEAGDAVLTQWFERARFEYHPDKPAEYRVLLGLLGREAWGVQARPAASNQPAPPPVADLPRVVSSGPPPSSVPSQIEEPATTTPSATPLSEPSPVTSSPTPEPSLPPPSATSTVTHTPVIPSATPSVMPSETAEPAPPSPTLSATVMPVTPSPTPPAERTPIASPEPDDIALKQELFELVDALHQEAGCAPFVRDGLLALAAQAHAEDIAAHKRIDHVGTDGATLRERLARVGYPYNRASESIAVYKTPEIAVHFWMDEPPDGPHRLNITNCQYTDVGIGLAYDSRGWRWWVMDVASRRPGN